MAATIHDLHEELEVLNQTMTTILTLQQTQQMQREAVGPGGGASDDKSMLVNMVTTGFTIPFEAMADKAAKILQMAANMVQSVDNLEYTTLSDGRNTRAQIALLLEESRSEGEDAKNLGMQIGGVLENVVTMNNALQVGISLDKDSDKRLRNQITILDKQGAQGQMLLNFTKDLVGMGFTRKDAKESLQHLTDIGFYSIQNAQHQANMLKRMNDYFGITLLQEPKLANDMRQMLEVTLVDVDPTKKAGFMDQLKLALFPEGDDIAYRQFVKGADEFAAISERLAGEFSAAFSVDPVQQQEDRIVIINKWMEASDIFAQHRKDAADIISDDKLARAKQLDVPFMKQVFEGLMEANQAMAATDADRAVQQVRDDQKFLQIFSSAFPAEPGALRVHAYEAQMLTVADGLVVTGQRMFQESLKELDPVSKALQEAISQTVEPVAAALVGSFGTVINRLNQFGEVVVGIVEHITGANIGEAMSSEMRLQTRAQLMDNINSPMRGIYGDWPRRSMYPGGRHWYPEDDD